MRLESVRLKGLGTFREEVAIDFAELGDAKIVAVVGANGAGKSTFLELALPGALYRKTPTRGSLNDLALDRLGVLEARVVNGRAWTIRHHVDVISGKGESLVLDDTGRPAFEDSKVKSFDVWAAANLPSESVFYASTFSPQGAGGFLEMKPAERKAVLLRVLGIEHYEALAERARLHERESKDRLLQCRAALEQERGHVGDVEALDNERRALEATLTKLESNRLALLGELANAEQCQKLRVELAELSAQLTDVTARIANNAKLLAEKEAIEAAVKRYAALGAMIAETDGIRRVAAAAEDKAMEGRARAESESVKGAVRGEQQRALAEQATRQLEELDALIKQAGSIREARAECLRADARLRRAREAIEVVRALDASGSDERVGKLRRGLELVGCAEDGTPLATVRTLACETLEADDLNQAAVKTAPLRLSALEAKQRHAEEYRLEARQKLSRAEDAKARSKERGAYRTAIEQATMAAASEEALSKDAEESMRLFAEQARTCREEHERTLAALGELEQEFKALEPAFKKVDVLARAEARLSELEPQRETLLKRIHDVRNDIQGLAVEGVRIEDLNASIADVAREIREAAHLVSSLFARREMAIAARARMATLEGTQRAEESELGDWSRLAQDLGREGLQNLEIDAAGPELSELVNDLLHTCVSRRWTVTIETTRLSADGKRLLEGCDVRVVDTERGRDADAETLSGGEKVIVSEALALALSMLACRRSGVSQPTIVRDETGAALDANNGRSYIAMLRRAAELVDADRIFFVSHAPELQELADARLLIDAGTVRIA